MTPTPEARPHQPSLSTARQRNIAPCATCHGGIDDKAGSAWLEGQSPVYLRTQLEAFGSGRRHNDISQQMRNVARGMTAAEIAQAAAYYASQPGLDTRPVLLP